MGILEKIKEIGIQPILTQNDPLFLEDEMARTQKNKATECHFGVMKARLAKLRQEVFSSSFLPIFNPILIDCSFLNSYLILLLQVAVASPVKVSMSPDRVMLVLPLLVSLLLVNPLY